MFQPRKRQPKRRQMAVRKSQDLIAVFTRNTKNHKERLEQYTRPSEVFTPPEHSRETGIGSKISDTNLDSDMQDTNSYTEISKKPSSSIDDLTLKHSSSNQDSLDNQTTMIPPSLIDSYAEQRTPPKKYIPFVYSPKKYTPIQYAKKKINSPT